jgi:uncharacterized iron-regulated membrane protein
MTKKIKQHSQAGIIRIFRKIHRISGISLVVFMFVIAVTGIMLGWKKNSGELLQAKTYTGTTSDLKRWLPLDSLTTLAVHILHDSISPCLSPEIDRIDIRAEKGIVKFIFKNHFWGIQLDGASGRLLKIESRRSDIVEKIHDGSILDYYLGTTGDQIKLVYTSITGLALLLFSVTGFWLWYWPGQQRRQNKKRERDF